MRDYLAKDRPASKATVPLSQSSQRLTPGSDSPALSEPTQLENKGAAFKENEAYYSWVLKHVSVANVQPIVEAIDEDVSGFISIQEVNQFALSRPQGTR